MGKCLFLDAQQIASVLHDYFAEHAAELFQDERAALVESYLVFDRGNVRAVCAYGGGDDAIIDWQRVIDKLPHGGDRAFMLRTEELRALGKGNAKLLRRDVCFAQRKATALPPEYVRLMTWNEAELKEMLFRQLFDFVGQHFTFRPDMFHAGMWAEFNGMQSVAAFFWGSTSFSVSKEVLVNLPYREIKDWGFRYYQNIAEDGSLCPDNK